MLALADFSGGDISVLEFADDCTVVMLLLSTSPVLTPHVLRMLLETHMSTYPNEDPCEHQGEQEMITPRTLTLVAIIFAIAVFRYLPHPPNVSPVAAISLFAGAFFYDRRLAFVVPFAVLLISDLMIGLHNTMIFVYIAFGLSVVIGMCLRSRRTVTSITLATLGSSLLFFAISNFGVWMMGAHGYAMNASGLIQTYVAGIPFLQNSVLGNLLFVAIMFGGFSLLQKLRPGLVRA